MYDPVGGLVAALIALAFTVFCFLLFGRVVGWLLGISTISKNQCTIIEQNEELIEIMDKSLRLQQAVASKQNIRLEPDEDEAEEKGG